VPESEIESGTDLTDAFFQGYLNHPESSKYIDGLRQLAVSREFPADENELLEYHRLDAFVRVYDLGVFTGQEPAHLTIVSDHLRVFMSSVCDELGYPVGGYRESEVVGAPDFNTAFLRGLTEAPIESQDGPKL
jgi:hypothetical protein